MCVCVCVCVFPSPEKWARGRAIDRGEVVVGTLQSQTIPPGLFWRFHMTVHHPTYIKFNLSLSHNALLGVYGRRNIPPTHTQVEEAPRRCILNELETGKKSGLPKTIPQRSVRDYIIFFN